MIRLPQVQGIIESLVGPDPPLRPSLPAPRVARAIWKARSGTPTPSSTRGSTSTSSSSTIPHDTPREMGGTMFLPGSQFRRIHESDIGRYQNFVGQLPDRLQGRHAASSAITASGTAPSPTSPTSCATCSSSGSTPPCGSCCSGIRTIWTIRRSPASCSATTSWYGNDDRLEYANRIKFWRFLTGNEQYDAQLLAHPHREHAGAIGRRVRFGSADMECGSLRYCGRMGFHRRGG